MADIRGMFDRDVVAGRVSQPGFAELERRERDRVRRHRVAGAAAIAAAIAVPLLALSTLGGGDTPPPPAQTPSPSPSQLEFPSSSREWSEYLVNVDVADTSNLFAVYSVGPEDDCVRWLSASHDGGQSWSELRELPGYRHEPSEQDVGGCDAPDLSVLSAQTLVLVDRSEPPVPSLVSYDHGRTWQQYRSRPSAAETVPPGVSPYATCQEGPGGCRIRLSWYDPGTGDLRVVESADPVAVRVDTWAEVATDGSVWLVGPENAGPERVVLVSRDDGRTWQVMTFPEVPLVGPGEYGSGTSVVTSDGTTAYFWALVGGHGWVYRTTDGGRTWQELPYQPPHSVLVDLWVAPDGALIAWDDGGQVAVSHDGGETFQPATVPVQSIGSVVGGFTGAPLDFDDPADVYLSDDGRAWQPVSAPRPG